jgi:hypothetical protein
VNTRRLLGLILEKESYSGSMSELGCSRGLGTSSSPRYQPFDANPDQTTDRHSAASNRFCEIFDKLAPCPENPWRYSVQSHSRNERVTRNVALPPRSLLRHAPQARLKQLRPHPIAAIQHDRQIVYENIAKDKNREAVIARFLKTNRSVKVE